MSTDPASRPSPQPDANSFESFPEIEPTELNKLAEDIARGPSVKKVPQGHIVLTSPLPVVSQVSAQGQMARHSPPTPSSTRAEQGSALEASADHAAMEPSRTEPNALPGGPGDHSDSISDDTPEVAPGHMPDDSSHFSAENAVESTAREPAYPSTTQSPATDTLAVSRIPIIFVQHPTRDPSQSLDEVTPEHPPEPDVAKFFVKAPLRRVSASPDITTAAPDIPVAAVCAIAALPWQVPTTSPQPVFLKPSKSRLLLRKCRNRVATEPLLQLALGRSVAKVTKPALYHAAHPTEAVLALEDAGSPAR